MLIAANQSQEAPMKWDEMEKSSMEEVVEILILPFRQWQSKKKFFFVDGAGTSTEIKLSARSYPFPSKCFVYFLQSSKALSSSGTLFYVIFSTFLTHALFFSLIKFFSEQICTGNLF